MAIPPPDYIESRRRVIDDCWDKLLVGLLKVVCVDEMLVLLTLIGDFIEN